MRYIHLNPIRANMVQAMKDLDRYRWSGHGTIVGKVDYAWMDCNYVLRWFGGTVRGARISYREFEKKRKLLNEYGLTKAETARQLGVSTSAISKRLSRQKEKS